MSKRRLCRCAFLFKYESEEKRHHFRANNNIFIGNDLNLWDADVQFDVHK